MAQQKKFAIQILVRSPDGTMRPVYVDARTGEHISDVAGYHIVSSGSEGWSVSAPEGKDKKETTSQKIIEDVTQEDRGSTDRGGGQNDSTSPNIFPDESNTSSTYVDKNPFMRAAGFLPGPMGMVGKAINLGVNLNNMGAVANAQRELGIEPQRGFLGNVKSFFKGPGPEVGEFTTPRGHTLGVSFNPQPPGPDFSVHPDTARSIMSRPATETTFADTLGYTPGSGLGVPENLPSTSRGEQGFLSRITGIEEGAIGRGLKNMAGDFVDRMFNRNTSYDTNYFPAAPQPPQNSGGFIGSNQGYGYSGGFDSDYADSISPAASDAISSGAGGLF